jgi:desulfoferrodoxin-like iron-binding protein
MIVKGTVYRCPVCGAEVAVARSSKGAFAPVCCNRPMVRRRQLMRVYHCDVCGSEVMVLLGGDGDMELVCCNVPMRLITGAKAA